VIAADADARPADDACDAQARETQTCSQRCRVKPSQDDFRLSSAELADAASARRQPGVQMHAARK
jgi:hypothetical protein